ncbi:hypothetical protein NGF19_18255 [Streptomyces sp. RY43-2]|uniref:PH domain-containing protein n=1 Tax=Streptomyces macrolidinus TaxID=2952607 RepID=A0ABT0ZGN4_9ACTN|nr:hypothetical protein [Streptomyces macrolidinus]MCN9242715.1 hypothetical protein [Streptomyces macrolidinus]
MPLPFLTADRTFEQGADDQPLPADDHERWRRPYRPGPWRVSAAAVLLMLSSYVLFAALVIAMTGTPSGAFTVLGIALVVLAGALRMLRMGVWVSAHGLRRVGFFLTRTTPWQKAAAVRTVQQPVRWLGLPRTVQGQALVLVHKGRTPGATGPLLTTHDADFLARPQAFDRAADGLEAWAAEYSRG